MMLPKDPFLPATLRRPKVKDFIRNCVENFGLTRNQAKKLYNDVPDEVFRNKTYAVFVYKREPHGLKDLTVWHLSIKRHDKEPIHDWRDLQEIKNAICGPEYEAMELYPAEFRVVDAANQYHLYVIMDKGVQIPVGYTTGRGAGRSENSFLGSKNRRFRKDDQHEIETE